jgi:hypothetical protein
MLLRSTLQMQTSKLLTKQAAWRCTNYYDVGRRRIIQKQYKVFTLPTQSLLVLLVSGTYPFQTSAELLTVRGVFVAL